jgi:hypothetical protein
MVRSWAALVVFGTSCALTLPAAQPALSRSLEPDPTTELAHIFDAVTSDHLGDHQDAMANDSGFELLDNGRQSLTARLALIDTAERSIDIQSCFQPAGLGRSLKNLFFMLLPIRNQI